MNPLAKLVLELGPLVLFFFTNAFGDRLGVGEDQRIFVATSVAIGVVSFSAGRFGWIPVALGLVGARFLFYGSMLLVFEARLALSTTHAEMDFIWRTSRRVVPKKLAEQHKTHHVHFRKHRDE